MMIMDDQSWYVVRHTPGVSNFVGVGNRPLPVSPAEIDEILIKIGEKEAPAAPKVEITCEIGDRVRVLSGPFAGAEGRGKWIKVASFEGANRYNACSFVVNNSAYVMCGQNGTSESSYYDDVWNFDPTQDYDEKKYK